MKEKRLYTCEVCGTDFNDKTKAMECENGHVAITCIKDFRYLRGGMYPNKVEIKFDDGTTKWYRE